jgi:hypothetical protein
MSTWAIARVELTRAIVRRRGDAVDWHHPPAPDPRRIDPVSSAEAKNLEAISRAIDQHNSNCAYPAAEVRMNPFEVERLGWEEIRGLPVVADPAIGTGRFRIVCSREGGGIELEEVEAIGSPVEVGVPGADPERRDEPG